MDFADRARRADGPARGCFVSAAPTGFLGLSHLGIVSSVGWASLGGEVRAVDLDAAPVAMLQRGELPVLEPGLADLFAGARKTMSFSTDPATLAECRLVVISRDVPTDDANVADPSVVWRLVDAVLPHLRPGVTIALTSQVPAGFTRKLRRHIASQRPDLTFTLHYWVETLVFGNAVERYLKPERIIVGCADPAAPLAPALAEGLRRFPCPVLPMRYESAELTKTAINLYLCAAVTYANTLGDLCEAVGADWAEMTPALRLDRRIGGFAYIRPGLGISGGNLERDLVTLSNLCRANGVDGRFIDAMIEYDGRRLTWLQRQLDDHVFAAGGHPVIAVWGLTYKKNTRSTKNSIALRVIGELQGRADVRAYDPVIGAGDVDVAAKVMATPEETLAGADCLLILTDWDDFATPALPAFQTMRRRVVIDGVGVLDRSRVAAAGVRCVAMGVATGA